MMFVLLRSQSGFPAPTSLQCSIPHLPTSDLTPERQNDRGFSGHRPLVPPRSFVRSVGRQEYGIDLEDSRYIIAPWSDGPRAHHGGRDAARGWFVLCVFFAQGGRSDID